MTELLDGIQDVILFLLLVALLVWGAQLLLASPLITLFEDGSFVLINGWSGCIPFAICN